MRSLVIPAFALWLFSLSSKASSVMFDFIEMFFSLQNFLCCSVNAFIEMFIIGDLVSVYTSSTTSWTIFWAKFRWIVPKMCKLNRDYSEISYGPSQWSSLFQSSQNISGLVSWQAAETEYLIHVNLSGIKPQQILPTRWMIISRMLTWLSG